MSERKRRHDDVHFPLQGGGRRAPKGVPVRPHAELVPYNPGAESMTTPTPPSRPDTVSAEGEVELVKALREFVDIYEKAPRETVPYSAVVACRQAADTITRLSSTLTSKEEEIEKLRAEIDALRKR
jgi:hypothetical protein